MVRLLFIWPNTTCSSINDSHSTFGVSQGICMGTITWLPAIFPLLVGTLTWHWRYANLIFIQTRQLGTSQDVALADVEACDTDDRAWLIHNRTKLLITGYRHQLYKMPLNSTDAGGSTIQPLDGVFNLQVPVRLQYVHVRRHWQNLQQGFPWVV